tara:strand:+ start:269 stop:583 length:315 start_codon:yes stop_codon:yes gene_type:complete
MNNSDTLLKATINRLTARFGEKILNTAAEIALRAKEAPENITKELELLKDEIYQEAERLENELQKNKSNDSTFENSTQANTPIEKIDLIRKKIAKLNKKFDTIQ